MSSPQLDYFPFHCSSLSLGLFPRAASCKCAFLCVLSFPLMLMVPLSFGQYLFSNKMAVQTPEGKQFKDNASVLKTAGRITSVNQ